MWAIQRFFCRNISGLLSRTCSRCLQLSPCPLRMQENVKCYFPISWPDESFQSLQESIPQHSVGGWGWSQNHTGLDPGYGTGQSCECRQLFSLCFCTVDSERVLPKSPWIPLTNVVRLSRTLTWFVPFIPGPLEDHRRLLRPLHWKQLRELEVLGVYSAWGSYSPWCNSTKSSDLDSLQDKLCHGIHLQSSCTRSGWGWHRTLERLFPCSTMFLLLPHQLPQGTLSFFL